MYHHHHVFSQPEPALGYRWTRTRSRWLPTAGVPCSHRSRWSYLSHTRSITKKWGSNLQKASSCTGLLAQVRASRLSVLPALFLSAPFGRVRAAPARRRSRSGSQARATVGQCAAGNGQTVLHSSGGVSEPLRTRLPRGNLLKRRVKALSPCCPSVLLSF